MIRRRATVKATQTLQESLLVLMNPEKSQSPRLVAGSDMLSNKRFQLIYSHQKKTRNKKSDDYSNVEEPRAKTSNRHLCTQLHDDEDYILSRKQASPPPEESRSRHSISTNSSQRNTGQEPGGHTAVIQSRPGHQAQRSCRESVTTDAAEAFHHSRRPQRQSRYETYGPDRVSKQSTSNEDSASSEATARKAPSFEDPIIRTSRTRSEEAARRRRLERSIDREGFHRETTGLSHGIHPSEDDEVVVVTERYVYRPRHLSHVQEEDLKDHRQEIPDRATARAEKPYQQFAAETEASDYYRNDCSGVSEQDEAGRQRVRPKDLEGLNALAESHTSDTSSSSRYRGKSSSSS